MAELPSIADLEPYAEYKNAGLPWLDQIPAHWDLVPNRGLIRRRKVLVGEKHTQYQLLSLTKRGVITRDISSGKGKFSSDMGTSQEVRAGDFVFCLFDVPETPRTVGLSSHDGMITGAYTVFEFFGQGSSEYFELFYKAMDDRKLLSPLYSGLRSTIPRERLLGVKTPQPRPEEQVAIVRFLGWATTRLDRAVWAKRKAIALLIEQKQAVIQSAVTRGLDHSLPMKPSGIHWLGDIPKHWEVRRLRASITDCVNGIWGADPDGEDDLICVRVADFDRQNLRVDLRKKTIRSVPQSARARRLLRCGDLLLEKSGGGDLQPVGAVVAYKFEEPAVCSNFVARMPIAPGYHYSFVNYVHSALYANRINVLSVKQTTGIQNLDWKSYLSERMPFPGYDEQESIARHLDMVAEQFATAISRLEREVELLREYRTRLVADVVTGKLDVRNVASGLPESTPLDSLEADANLSDEIGTAEEDISL